MFGSCLQASGKATVYTHQLREGAGDKNLENSTVSDLGNTVVWSLCAFKTEHGDITVK